MVNEVTTNKPEGPVFQDFRVVSEDLTHWPLLRLAGHHLTTTDLIYIFDNGRRSLLWNKEDEVFALPATAINSRIKANPKQLCSVAKVTQLSGQKVVQIVGGDGHFMALTFDGRLLAWGDNESGAVGVGQQYSVQNEPVVILTDVRLVRCGRYHTVAYLNSGLIASWGENFFGQLATGDTVHRFKPFHLQNMKNVTDLYCGPFCTLLVIACREIRFYGQKGDETATVIGFVVPPPPSMSDTTVTIVNLAVFEDEFFALTTDGLVARCLFKGFRWQKIYFHDKIGQLISGSPRSRMVVFVPRMANRRYLCTGGRLLHTQLTSIADLFSLHGWAQDTPGLTHVHPNALGRMDRRMNDAASATLRILCQNKTIHIHKDLLGGEVIKRLVTHLRGNDHYYNPQECFVELQGERYAGLFSYLRFLYSKGTFEDFAAVAFDLQALKKQIVPVPSFDFHWRNRMKNLLIQLTELSLVHASHYIRCHMPRLELFSQYPVDLHRDLQESQQMARRFDANLQNPRINLQNLNRLANVRGNDDFGLDDVGEDDEDDEDDEGNGDEDSDEEDQQRLRAPLEPDPEPEFPLLSNLCVKTVFDKRKYFLRGQLLVPL